MRSGAARSWHSGLARSAWHRSPQELRFGFSHRKSGVSRSRRPTPTGACGDASNTGGETFACLRPTDDFLGGGRLTECACYRGAEREANGAGVRLLIWCNIVI